MRQFYPKIYIIVVMLVAACASVPTRDIQVDAKIHPKVNFGGYQTYAWLGTAEIVNDPYGQWEPLHFDADAEVKFLIDRELRKRGMSENSSTPDALVLFAAGIDMQALGLKEDPDTKIDMIEHIPQGGLAILLIDARRGFIIWAGTATGEVQDRPDTQVVKARLEYAVTQMFKKYPK